VDFMENSLGSSYKVGEAQVSSHQTPIPNALTSLYASYDGENIRFANPHTLRPGDRLIVTVLPHDEELAEREEWFALSAAGLEEAYGDDEPEYTLAHIKERNPAYAGG